MRYLWTTKEPRWAWSKINPFVRAMLPTQNTTQQGSYGAQLRYCIINLQQIMLTRHLNWRAKRRRKLPSYSSLNSQEMPLSFKHIFAVISYTMPLFLEASVYTWHCPNIHVSECLAPRHSGRDAFSGAIIFLLRFVTKYYSLTLKITASVLHGFRKRVRELMVSENRWLTLSPTTKINML